MDIRVNDHTLVVFDLDDTLYNEMAYLQSAYRTIAVDLDPAGWKELYAYMLSLFRSKKDVFGTLEQKFNTTKEQLLHIYRHHKPEIVLFEGISSLIAGIKKHKGRIGILTDGREVTQMNKITALGLEDMVDKIVISESLGSEKPAQANYQVFEEAYPGFTYYYIADNLRKDFITANERGWNTIGLIDNGLNMHFDGHKYFKDQLKPKHFVNNFLECRII